MPKRTHDGLRKRCDCGPRKWATCAHPWFFSFYHAGKEHRFSLDKVARARNEDPPKGTTEAKAWRDKLRGEIRGKTFTAASPADTRLTFGDVVDHYKKRYVKVPTRGAKAMAMFDVHLNMLLRAQVPSAHQTTIALKDKPIAEITKADIEHLRMKRREQLAAARAAQEVRAAKEAPSLGDADRELPKDAHPKADAATTHVRRPGVKQGEVGINRLLTRLRHVFSWAIVEGYLTATPFKRAGEKVIFLTSDAEGHRNRRLREGEEAALLLHADPLLHALIIAALSTGCRLGELLALCWSQVAFDAKGEAEWVTIVRTKTKTNMTSVLPISRRLRAVLAMRRHAPDGEPHPATAYVFGNAVGEQVTSIRVMWEAAVQAAGIEGLHFHDLRREFACQLLESSSALHDVSEFLGHANVSTTSTYLKSTSKRLSASIARMDEAQAATAAAATTDKDSHGIRTNDPKTENGRSEGSAVTH